MEPRLRTLLDDPSINAKAWYLLSFAASVAVGPFLNIYFQQLGLTHSQVGVIGALRRWVSAPSAFAWAALADRRNAHQAILLFTFVGSVAARLLILLPRRFWGLLAATLLAECLRAPVNVLADAAAVRLCAKGSDYGKFRLWGAVGWGAFSTPAGWIITRLGIQWAFYTNTLMSLPCVYFGARLHSMRPPAAAAAAAAGQQPVAARAAGAKGSGMAQARDEVEAQEMVPLLQAAQQPATGGASGQDGGPPGHPPGVVATGGGKHDQALAPAAVDAKVAAVTAPAVGYWARLWRLVRQPEVAVFLLTAAANGYGWGTIDCFLYMYLKQLGASEALVGVAVTITCAAEVPAFQLQDRLLDRWGVTAVLDLVQAAYVLRLALYALLPYAGSVLWVLPVEVLHGVTFACGWGAGTVNCKTLAPPGLAATMQGTFQGLTSAGFGLGALVGGRVGAHVGWQGMFAVASVTVLGMWCSILTARGILSCLKHTTPPQSGPVARGGAGSA
ncbi:hypothetical protein HYH02_000329 [Chlamydomonas schloesseri]|uniref:Major facilitator superfamily (MFS) profile domain-containing protein n=1 Tax=Chlamydomonas schloesseri TaxID=2026947 RepID=A0A836B7T5_9CHLO|nr:hypothetical protein HYH02_000329 [Chlamydomonas schloesseri]|eukprot:KAG2450232.1 hypothetical protein HYH02_000329 [Chlamydomonas schloesseri]